MTSGRPWTKSEEAKLLKMIKGAMDAYGFIDAELIGERLNRSALAVIGKAKKGMGLEIKTGPGKSSLPEIGVKLSKAILQHKDGTLVDYRRAGR